MKIFVTNILTFFTLFFLALSPSVGLSQPANDYIEKRQKLFESIESDLKNLKQLLKAKPFATKEITTTTRQIEQNSILLLESFPEGSHEGDTRARKRIWGKWQDFDSRLNAFHSVSSEIHEAAMTEDREKITNGMKKISKQCRNCHMRYRALW